MDSSQLIHYLTLQKGNKFNVDEETGEVFTNKVFDREGEDGKQVSVTVKAVDAGEPSLEGVCSFTVEILDTNDNPPLFDRQVGLKLIFYHFMPGSLQILVTSFLGFFIILFE